MPPVRQHTTPKTSYSLSFSEFPPSDPDPERKNVQNTHPEPSSSSSSSYSGHTVRPQNNQFWTQYFVCLSVCPAVASIFQHQLLCAVWSLTPHMLPVSIHCTEWVHLNLIPLHPRQCLEFKNQQQWRVNIIKAFFIFWQVKSEFTFGVYFTMLSVIQPT